MRAYSLFEVKSLAEDRRIISGTASTPTPDRVRDVVEPLGMTQRGPVNLFLYHAHNLPVGHVEFGRPKKTGVSFEASIPDVVEEGVVRERVKEAWHSVKYRLLQAVSIGFKPLGDAVEVLSTGGLRFMKWEMLELSLVGVPANPDATISAFKSTDAAAIRRAIGVDESSDQERRALVARLRGGAVELLPIQRRSEGAVRLTLP
jgi:HK97 family phage prohead protease